MINKERFGALAKEWGIFLDEGMLSRFDAYASFLTAYNEKVNLTAITEPEAIEIRHFLDSLALLTKVEIPQNASLIDVGCGAGFPSVPLAIARTDLTLTLLDSLNKRVLFLKELCTRLSLKAAPIHARAEDAGRQVQYREVFDVATARAVAHLRELSEYCLPFVKVGGMFLALKGPELSQELMEAKRAITLLGGRVEDALCYNLPDESGRTLVVIRKVAPTPPLYPRPSAKMAKKPLI